jgi:hypothetical protein
MLAEDGAAPTVSPMCDSACVVVAGATTEALEQALTAQLGGMEIAPLLADLPAVAPTRDAVETGCARLRKGNVRVVVWLEPTGDGVHIRVLDVDRRALFERQIAAGDELATAEAVGVVVRRALEDLTVAGVEPEGLDPVTIAPPTPRAVPRAATRPEPPPPRPRHRLRIGVDYVGEMWARELPWQSGVLVQLGWIAPFGLYLGAHARAVPPLTVRDAAADLRVARHPVEIAIGYSLRRGRLAIDASVVAIVDVLTAVTTPQRFGVTTRDSTRVDGGIAPRLRVGVRALDWLVVGGGIGLDVFPRAFPYAVESAQGLDRLLAPRRVRPQLLVGIAFEPSIGRRKTNQATPGGARH